MSLSAIMLPPSFPAEPYPSLRVPLMKAIDMTMRFMNSVTDITIVRIILDQVCSRRFDTLWGPNRKHVHMLVYVLPALGLGVTFIWTSHSNITITITITEAPAPHCI